MIYKETLNYSTELFDLDTIKKFHDDYLDILSELIAEPDKILTMEKVSASEAEHSAELATAAVP